MRLLRDEIQKIKFTVKLEELEHVEWWKDIDEKKVKLFRFMESHNEHDTGVFDGVRYTFDPEKQSKYEDYFFDNHEAMEVIYILEMLKNIEYEVSMDFDTNSRGEFNYEEIHEIIEHLKNKCAIVKSIASGDHGISYKIYKHPKADNVFLDVPTKDEIRKTVFVAASISIVDRPSVRKPEPKLYSAEVNDETDVNGISIVDEDPDRILSIREDIDLANHEERYIDDRGL